MTSRGPLTLAALASAAVPGLDPDTVQGVVASGPADPVEVAFIQDREHRRWVIRCPRTPATSAHLERSAALLAVLARRLTMPVPAVKGWVALPEGGRAAVHSYLTGRLVSLEGVRAGSDLAKGLGRALAHLHNLDASTYEEAGVPVYDAAGYRSRRLAELDRAAATGRVPTGLLSRWERVLDDESLWGFRATPTHGALGEDAILATPDDGQTPDVKAFLAWESAQVADPADDIAPLLATMDAEAFDTVMEAYAHTRVERPDRHLHRRAEVVGEMQLVRSMMALVAAGDDAGAEDSARELRRLDERLARDEEEAARIHGTKGARPTDASAGAGAVAASGDEDKTDDGAGAETADTTRPTDTQPVTTGTPASTTNDTTRSGGTTATTEELRLPRPDRWDASDDGDAVEVEHPAQVTPVAPADEAADSEPAGDDAEPDTDEAGADTGPGPALHAVPDQEPEDAPDSQEPKQLRQGGGGDDDPAQNSQEPKQLRADDDAATESQDPRELRTGGDAEDPVTAEIVPIDDDGDDDVVPPQPRR